MKNKEIIDLEIMGYNVATKIGTGAYGAVYLGVKEELGRTYHMAIKHISFPDKESYEEVLSQCNYDASLAVEHFQKMLEDMVSETELMHELGKKDNRFIVNYYDHIVNKQDNPLKYDLFMRMEYLTPLSQKMRQSGMTLEEVLKLGINICTALELCHKQGIIHRDIKEGNIFINEEGNFKLGDFGVAKNFIEVTKAASMKGTASYMAPEIYLRQPYDTSVDIYALGIVMYKVLNHLRMPFMPDFPELILADDIYRAETSRLNGEVPPPPLKARNELGDIILKACAAKENRYESVQLFKKDLERCLESLTAEERQHNIVDKASEEVIPESGANQEPTLSLFNMESCNVDNEQAIDGIENKEDVRKIRKRRKKSRRELETYNPYDEQQPQSKVIPLVTKVKKICKRIVLIVITSTGIVGGSFLYYNSQVVNKFETAMDQDNIEVAKEVYSEQIKENATRNKSTLIYLKESLEKYESDYINEVVDYETTLLGIQNIEDLQAIESSYVTQVKESVNMLYLSRRHYKKGKEAEISEQYAKAIEEYRGVIKEDPNYEQTQKELLEVINNYKEQVFAEVDKFDELADHQSAIKVLNESINILVDDVEIAARINEYEKDILEEQMQIADKMIKEAEELAGLGKYEEAVVKLEEVIEYPHDINLVKDRIIQYTELFPVYIQDLVTYYNTGNINYEDWVPNKHYDNLNKSDYTNGWLFKTVDDDGWDSRNHYHERKIAYILEHKYTNLEGVFTTAFESKDKLSANIGYTLTIIGDGIQLYKSHILRGGVQPIKFDIDVTGINELEFMISGETGSVRDTTFEFGLVDTKLSSIPVQE